MTDETQAVVARRGEESPVHTAEIERLTEAAGYAVAETLTQTRPEDGATNLGSGLAETAARAVSTADADLLVVDNELTPTQTWNLADLCPPETRVLDRYRLVLEIFANGTGDKAAELQVELATLEYDLPRVKNAVAERDHSLSRFTEKGTPIQDLEARIEQCRRELNELEQSRADRREKRRSQGFDLVALAGYTNAGKSTLLHRLGDELSLADRSDGHADLTETAAVEDRLFRTLETTTRRATLDERELLVTDTVGLLDELPHDLIESFDSTISAATEADLTLVVADAAEEPATLQRKLQTALEVLDDADRRLIVLNKIDRLDASAIETRQETARTVTDDPLVTASATEGSLEALQTAIQEQLPDPEEVTFELPQSGETEQFLAWLYDRAVVDTVEYGPSTVQIAARARPAVAQQARGRADNFSGG